MTDIDPTVATPAGDPAQEPSADDSPETLRRDLAAANARAEEFRAQHLRAAAELDNYRKRAAREVDNARQFGVERFAGELLAVIDSLELGLAAGDKADPGTLREGQEATLRLLVKAFEKSGISALDPVGAAFDPGSHEAVAMQPADGEPNRILAVVQKGYVLNGRLLRPARVVVSRAPDA
jgi:molecular chaperone GrpE